jgi:DNA mismatch endonuclease (patch repair protein)
MMSGIRSKDTKPETLIRKGLHKLGFRYRLHEQRLPGKPDLVFPRYRAVIFVHGCFWHGHNCPLFKWPSSRQEFWRQKIEGNQQRDQLRVERLLAENWRVCTVWECQTRKNQADLLAIYLQLAEWLKNNQQVLEIG